MLPDGEAAAAPDWHPAPAVALTQVVGDLVAPAVELVGDVLGGLPPSVPSPLAYVAADTTGIPTVRAAVGRRVRGGCRFLYSRGWTRRRACSRPYFTSTGGAEAWISRTRALPAGRYDVRFRATDVGGRTTPARPPRVIEIR